MTETAPITAIGNALIVGGGIGGMAAALALAARGVTAELIDIDPDWRVYGAGITITGPTLRAYQRLGMVEDIAREGAIVSGSRMFLFNGMHMRDLDEPPIEEGLPATGGIMRPVLHHLMQQRIEAASIPVRLGVTVETLANRDGGVDVTFSDGTAGRYDLVIGADSVRSRVRELAFPHMGDAVRTGQGCWRVAMAKPPSLERGEMFFGHRYMVGITRCGVDRIYMWLLTPHEDREERLEGEALVDQMKTHLADFAGNAGWVRDTMSAQDWVNYRPLEAKIQPRPWSDGRIVLLGDAVHATTPHLASGAGMAVESALVLAEELARAGTAEDALMAYEERRYERCRDVVETSVAIGAAQLAGRPGEEIGGIMGAALHRLAGPF
ncbi:MAG: FAD-dependent monooxygenase [Novosphingobium sp.]|uniref:FAD-dependent monooxygenase n=1 Tax=Novosphingobium sp. TaxID=1874826 RepID=UPI003015BA1E